MIIYDHTIWSTKCTDDFDSLTSRKSRFQPNKKKGQNGSAGFENNGIITATTPLLDGFFSAAKLKPVNGETRTMEGPVREQPGVEGVVEIGNDSGAVPGVASFDFNWYSYILGGGFKLFFIFTPTWGVPFLGWLRDPFKWLVVSDIFLFSSLLVPGEMIQLDEHIFFKWVETTTN